MSVMPERIFSHYAYFSSASEPVVEHARELVEFVGPYMPQGDGPVVEIGSNDGYLLTHHLRAGRRVLGVDPATNVAAVARASGVSTLEAFFSRRVATLIRRDRGPARVVHANNVLAHVPDIADVLAGVRILLAGGDGVLVAETPSLHELVTHCQFDTIYHEHVFYYSFSALERLLESAGLRPIHAELVDFHGGSLRVVATAGRQHPDATVAATRRAEQRAGVGSLRHYAGLATRVGQYCDNVRRTLDEVVASGGVVAGFGAAAKGTMLVAATRIPLSFVCDTTRFKQGRHLPGTGIPIVPPEQLVERMPDYCVVLAWNYATAIVRRNSEYARRGGVFLVPGAAGLEPLEAGAVIRSAG
jgi:hypothetical protein